jgi:hypothetical protein
MEENKSAYDRVMEKAAEKKQAAKERKEVREESGIVNKLVIERTPVGLYQARYSMRGQVRILTIAKQKGIEVENAA